MAMGAWGCATPRGELGRAQRAYEQNAHEHALAVLRVLESDLPRLGAEERARYAYLRGMSDYRIGYKTDARHWLGMAKAFDEMSQGALPEDWRARTNQTLVELTDLTLSEAAP